MLYLFGPLGPAPLGPTAKDAIGCRLDDTVVLADLPGIARAAKNFLADLPESKVLLLSSRARGPKVPRHFRIHRVPAAEPRDFDRWAISRCDSGLCLSRLPLDARCVWVNLWLRARVVQVAEWVEGSSACGLQGIDKPCVLGEQGLEWDGALSNYRR